MERKTCTRPPMMLQVTVPLETLIMCFAAGVGIGLFWAFGAVVVTLLLVFADIAYTVVHRQLGRASLAESGADVEEEKSSSSSPTSKSKRGSSKRKTKQKNRKSDQLGRSTSAQMSPRRGKGSRIRRLVPHQNFRSSENRCRVVDMERAADSLSPSPLRRGASPLRNVGRSGISPLHSSQTRVVDDGDKLEANASLRDRLVRSSDAVVSAAGIGDKIRCGKKPKAPPLCKIKERSLVVQSHPLGHKTCGNKDGAASMALSSPELPLTTSSQHKRTASDPASENPQSFFRSNARPISVRAGSDAASEHRSPSAGNVNSAAPGPELSDVALSPDLPDRGLVVSLSTDLEESLSSSSSPTAATVGSGRRQHNNATNEGQGFEGVQLFRKSVVEQLRQERAVEGSASRCSGSLPSSPHAGDAIPILEKEMSALHIRKLFLGTSDHHFVSSGTSSRSEDVVASAIASGSDAIKCQHGRPFLACDVCTDRPLSSDGGSVVLGIARSPNTKPRKTPESLQRRRRSASETVRPAASPVNVKQSPLGKDLTPKRRSASETVRPAASPVNVKQSPLGKDLTPKRRSASETVRPAASPVNVKQSPLGKDLTPKAKRYTAAQLEAPDGYCAPFLPMVLEYIENPSIERPNLNEFSADTQRNVMAMGRWFTQFYKERWKYLRLRRARYLKMEHDIFGKLERHELSHEEAGEIRKEKLKKESKVLRLMRVAVKADDFTILSRLGKGGFGEVYLARHNDSSKVMALKRMNKAAFAGTSELERVKRERDVMTKIPNCPWLVTLHMSFQTPTHLFLGMEYLPGGDLKQLLSKVGRLDEWAVRQYVAEMIMAVSAIHQLGYVHRDLKPANFLISKTGHLKLIDFGLSKEGNFAKRQQAMRVSMSFTPAMIEAIRNGSSPSKGSPEWAYSVVGSPEYMAPEILEVDTGYDESVDWWAIGIIAFEMLYGFTPFDGDNVQEIFLNIQHHEEALEFPNLEQVGDFISPECTSFIRGLITANDSRLGTDKTDGLAGMKRHPWFGDVDWDNLQNAKPPFVPNLQSEMDTSYFDTEITGKDAAFSESEDIDDLFNDEFTRLDSTRDISDLNLARATHFASPANMKDFAGFTYRSPPSQYDLGESSLPNHDTRNELVDDWNAAKATKSKKKKHHIKHRLRGKANARRRKAEKDDYNLTIARVSSPEFKKRSRSFSPDKFSPRTGHT